MPVINGSSDERGLETSARPSLPPARFSEISSVTAIAPGRFAADIHPEWNFADRINGGYLLAVLGRAAAASGSHPNLISASAHFARPVERGTVTVDVEVLREGRSTGLLRARMTQADQVCIEALVSTGRIDPKAEPIWDQGVPTPSMVKFEDCPRPAPRTPQGQRVPLLEQLELRLERGYTDWTTGRPSGRGELRGWLQLPGGEEFTPESLLLALDVFPPVAFDLGFSGWVPTLSLTGYIRALPAPGPVRMLAQARLVADGRVDEVYHLWDSAGRLVAQGSQLAALRAV